MTHFQLPFVSSEVETPIPYSIRLSSALETNGEGDAHLALSTCRRAH